MPVICAEILNGGGRVVHDEGHLRDKSTDRRREKIPVSHIGNAPRVGDVVHSKRQRRTLIGAFVGQQQHLVRRKRNILAGSGGIIRRGNDIDVTKLRI